MGKLLVYGVVGALYIFSEAIVVTLKVFHDFLGQRKL
jgi:hypothetical protein